MMTRRKEYYAHNPVEREYRRAQLRALLALPPEGRERLERRELPTAEEMAAAAARSAVPVEFVGKVCTGFLFCFRGGLTRPPRAGTDSEN